MIKIVFVGNFVHARKNAEAVFIQFVEDAVLGVSTDGKIAFVENSNNKQNMKVLQETYKFGEEKIVHLGKRFLIPGLIDTHIHAPQYPNAGTGTDLPLLEWLTKYTFPLERKYSDITFARDVYTKAVNRSLSFGTTTGCYFASIHLEATKVLVDVISKLGQRAFVGKVCMDRNSPEFYIETTQDSLQDTVSFVEHVVHKVKNPLITPVITPRFVPTCTPVLMKGLGELAKKYNIPIQSHISENKSEVLWVKELSPQHNSYSEVYNEYNLLDHKTIMAHGVYLTDDELSLFKKKNSGICHCPVSNFMILSGILDVNRVLKAGVKIGLGTDVSGGCSSSMLEVIRKSIVASNTLTFADETCIPLTYKEFFGLATIGGAEVLGLDDKIGNFLPGKCFDALVINPDSKDSPFDTFEMDQFSDVFQKFIFLGDDRNISAIFVDGNLIKGNL